MREGGQLVLDRLDQGRSAVADGGDGDARAEVNQGVAVHVDDYTATCRGGVDGHDRPDALGYGGGLPALQVARARTGDGREQATFLGERGAPGG
ncbi:hypothetical protein GCM10009554_82940 [Kribbella koreensis]|uniref:Uncharacterized protein n=1 Tax=Kribbella koreensis TaxID=57909 RepID=A0ABP4CAF2_9ACTN